MRSKGFERFAWFFAAYLVAVILFGAWVRITGSGAGCGSHWPVCDGEFVPTAPDIKKQIEYTHRLTSGMCGVFALILVGWAWRVYGHSKVLFASLATLFFVLVEGGIGAALVLQELVAENDSVARAVMVAVHLSNTLLLMAAASLAAWFAGGRVLPRPSHDRVLARQLLIGLVLIVLTSMTGAVTALGDTLFPIEPAAGPELVAKISADVSASNHFLIRLRALHPAVAVATAGYLLWLLIPLARGPRGSAWASAAATLVVIETAAGALNVALAAPGWMQIVHLLLANLLWVTTLLTRAERLSGPPVATTTGAEATFAAEPKHEAV